MKPETMTTALRHAILESNLPMAHLAEQTGVQRMSIVRFVEGRGSLRLDIADKLAEFFGLTLQPTSTRARRVRQSAE